MEEIRQYIITVCAAAMLCGIAKSLVGKSGSSAELVRFISGLFLAVTAISPLLKIEIDGISDLTATYQWEAEQAAQQGEQDARSTMEGIIITRTEAYILDKATSLDAQIEVDIRVSGDATPVPCSAVITGSVSPYAKTRLTEIMESDLGIPREAQQWNT